MRIRPYIAGKDYESIEKWIKDELTPCGAPILSRILLQKKIFRLF